MSHSDLKRLIDIFLELVAIDAVSGQEKPVADYIRNFLSQHGATVHEDRAGKITGGNSGNLIVFVPGLGDNMLRAFMAHMDTVQPTVGIKPQINNGIISSDGSTILGADNRAGIAIILYTIEKIKQSSFRHPPFEAIFTIGEETGLYGSIHLDLNQVKSKTVFILDSSASPGCYVAKAPCSHEFEIDLIGRASHAAVNPANGINAIKMAGKFIQEARLGQVDDQTTVNLGRIEGGKANNIVPEKVHITGEIRSLNHRSIKQHFRHIESSLQAVSRQYDGNYHLNTNEAFPGYQLNENGSEIQNLHNSFKSIGLVPQPLQYRGGSDANILNNRGLQAINLGIGAKKPHSFHEYIKIADMEIMSDLVSHLILS
jgi:tripeptide aminopeptidase